MERFQKLLEDPHKHAKEWKAKTGGKVLGYFSFYFPEEIAYAAGVLPVRILSQPDIEGISQRYMYNAFCPYSLGILAQGLKGNYDYLDGIGHAESCMPVRGAVANWWDLLPTPYKYYVAMPSQLDEPSVKDLLYAELKAFKKDMEKWTGKTVTKESLDHAIDVYNTSRRLMRQVYELRRLDNPPVSGAEAFEMIFTSQLMDKEEHNKLLKDAINKLSDRRTSNTGPRLMLLGSELSDTRLVRMIESVGATIVIDRLCDGSNYLWNNVIPQEDRLYAISERYVDRPRCPAKDATYRRRVREIPALAADFNVKGAIYVRQKGCEPHQWHRAGIHALLGDNNISFYAFEYDRNVSQIEEFKADIEAFINALK